MLTRSAELHPSPRGIEEAVRTRMRRQGLLYGVGRRYHIIVWEPVFWPLVCSPSVRAAQLDRLTGVTGMNAVELSIVPLTAPLKSRPA
ncbi:Scr1 family TA system antitoxin-like transcriptional regulator [Streptomyces huasconensis]|uniref:Scr1 family TA system antitoxin-like transcriptional regulator n=1 Tax=Streptomyces huasconensis TaxID=1854574 RepID=A0ABV3LSR0_9ACTN